MRILVTGPTGFVGRELCRTLAGAGFVVRAAHRGAAPPVEAAEAIDVGGIQPDTDWRTALSDVDVVIHLAARVHVRRDRSADPLPEYRRINVAATEHLARSAASQGVRRLIFVSSIKVNGERTADRAAFSETDPPQSEDSYGLSKWEAEQALWRIARETGLELVVLRPPLIYGPGVKANFLTLMTLIARGLPLPLGSIDNRRSLIYLNNLTDALRRCVDDPRAANQLFLISDGEDLSTPELIRRLARALGHPARLLPVPVVVMRCVAGLARQSGTMERLAGSLVVDSSKFRAMLDWTPPYSVEQGLQDTAAWFSATRNR